MQSENNMIYIFTDYNQITPDMEQELLDKLPPIRREKALRFTVHSGRISCIVSYMLFLYGFRKFYHMEGTPDFAGDKFEKPYLADYPDIHFNLSHCNSGCACIMDNFEVGIDLQEIRKVSLKTFEKICNTDEILEIQNSDNPEKEFCRIWSYKEALSKLTGEGIFRDISNISSSKFKLHTEYVEPDMYMSYASCKDIAQEIVQIKIDDLLEL